MERNITGIAGHGIKAYAWIFLLWILMLLPVRAAVIQNNWVTNSSSGAITGLIPQAAPNPATDFVAIFDDSAAGLRKVLLGNLPTGGGGEVNTGVNLGIGYPTFASKSGLNLQFNTFTNNPTWLSVTSNANTFTWTFANSVVTNLGMLSWTNVWTGTNTFAQLIATGLDINGNIDDVSGFIEQAEQSNPSTPGSGFGRWFVSTTGKPSFIDDAGLVSDLSSTTGGSFTLTNAITVINAADALYGASTNNADNTTNIQYALDAATNAPGYAAGLGGRRVFLPAGLYGITGQLRVHPYTTFEGEATPLGTGTRLYKTTSGPMIMLESPGSQLVKGLGLTSDTNTSGTIGIRSGTNSSTTNFKLENIQFAELQSGLVLTQAWDAEIISCYTRECREGFVFGPECNSMHVFGGQHDTDRIGIKVVGDACHNIVIDAVVIENSSFAGIVSTNTVAGGIQGLNVLNGYFEGNLVDGSFNGAPDAIYGLVWSGNYSQAAGVTLTNLILNDVYSPVIGPGNNFASNIKAWAATGITRRVLEMGNYYAPTATTTFAGASSIEMTTNIVVRGVGGRVNVNDVVTTNGWSNLGTPGAATFTAIGTSFNTTLSFTDPSANRAVLFRDAAGTVALSGDTFTGDVTGTLGSGGTTALTIAGNSVGGADIAIGGDVQGDLLYYAGTDYTNLPAGTSGQFLQTMGAGVNPRWFGTGTNGSGPFVLSSGSIQTNATFSGTTTNLALTASAGVVTDANKALASVAYTGSGNLMRTRVGVVRSMAVPMGAWFTNGMTGSLAALTNLTGSGDTYGFDDAVTNTVRLRLPMPVTWDVGTVKFQFEMASTGNNTSSTNVVYQLKAGTSLSNAGAEQTVTFGTAITFTNHVSAVSNRMVICTTGPLTIGNTPAVNAPVIFELTRLTSDAVDVNTNRIHVLGSQLFYTETATEPAMPTTTQ